MKINDLKYYLYHQNIGHLTRDFYILKVKLQVLIDVKVMQLRPKQKKVSVNATIITMGSLEILAGVTPIPAGKW